MLKRLHILVVAILLTTAAYGQGTTALPYACQGSVEKYWVKGFNGQSNFTWRITDPKGNDIPTGAIVPVNAGVDSVAVTWNFPNMAGGIYTMHIIEKTPWGCTGEEYVQDIMVNTPNFYAPISSFTNTTNNLVNLCKGGTYELEVQLTDGKRSILNNLSKWADLSQAFTVKRIISTAGTFTVQVVDDLSSCSFDTVRVISRELPKVSLGDDFSICYNSPKTITPTVDGGNIYSWTIDNQLVGTASTYVADAANIDIALSVSDSYSCVGSDTVHVYMCDVRGVRIPAAFTPNGDGFNDEWYIPEISYDWSFGGASPVNGADAKFKVENLKIEVFNRWGNLVYKLKSDGKAWDGKDMNGNPLPVDSYHYIVSFNYGGTPVPPLKGSVTIIL